MKKIFSVFIVAAILAGCSLPFTEKAPVTPQKGDTVSVDYVGTFDDGSEFDSSKKEWKTPLQFVIGANSVVKWFEEGIIGMKIGEKKKIRIEAKDGYGEEFMNKTVPLAEFREVITQKAPVGALTGNLEQKLAKDQAERLFVPLAVWTEKKIGQDTLKILSIGETDVVISINQPSAAFYGKKIAVGMKSIAQDGSEIIIKKITGNDVDVDIKPNLEIISKNEKEVTVKIKNPHPLAGKTLNFEVELISIKTPGDVSEVK